jgi:hypothetical protein
MAETDQGQRGGRMMKALLSALIRLLNRLHPDRMAPPSAVAPLHRPVSSHTRRYPGRSSALQLRQNLGWVVLHGGHAHRNRRA